MLHPNPAVIVPDRRAIDRVITPARRSGRVFAAADLPFLALLERVAVIGFVVDSLCAA